MKLTHLAYLALFTAMAGCSNGEDSAETSASSSSSDDQTPSPEAEPNDNPAEATPTPSDDFVVDGTLSQGDVDYWRVKLSPGAHRYAWTVSWMAGHSMQLDLMKAGDPTVYPLYDVKGVPYAAPALAAGEEVWLVVSPPPNVTGTWSYELSMQPY